MVLKKVITLVTIFACSTTTLVLASPGHSDDTSSESKPTFRAGQPGESQSVDRVIQVEASDLMRFTPENWTVTPGDTIQFVVSNTGQILHEFVIDTVKGNASHRKTMRETMAGDSMMVHDDPNSVSVLPGESDELIWTFSESGSFEAACNIPGHYQAGMRAQVSVFNGTVAHNP